VLGEFMGMFVATIVIFVILAVFVATSALIRKFDTQEREVVETKNFFLESDAANQNYAGFNYLFYDKELGNSLGRYGSCTGECASEKQELESKIIEKKYSESIVEISRGEVVFCCYDKCSEGKCNFDKKYLEMTYSPYGLIVRMSTITAMERAMREAERKSRSGELDVTGP
jgi:hypothetical protein